MGDGKCKIGPLLHFIGKNKRKKSFSKNQLNVEILQLRAKFQTAMVSCSRFILITNCSDHRRVWSANLLNTKYLPNPLGCLEPSGLGNYFVYKRFAIQTFLWSLKFVIQIKCSDISENKLPQEEKDVKNRKFQLQFPSCKFSSFKVFKTNNPISKWSPMGWL